ncbi:MAG: LOG family protein [Rhodobacterales bacterium]|nr:LOG family protein [Rhodobacterales bacterium]
MEFHYFFMRKFWFMYLAKALIVFPGGFGTLDELFETLTLLQTRKVEKHLPIVLFGTEFWTDVVNFDALVRHGTIDAEDVNLMFMTDSVDEAFDHITRELAESVANGSGRAGLR